MYAFVRARDARLRVHVVFVRDVTREVGGGEGDELTVVERLDALHVLVVHALATVHGDAFKRHRAAAFTAVVAGLGDDLVRGLAHAVVLRAECCARTDVRVEQPEGDIHGLDFLDAVLGGECAREDVFPKPRAVEFLERGDGVLFGLLERDDEVWAEHAHELARNHVRAAAVGALGRHRVAVGDELGAAGGTGLDLHRFRLGRVPFTACALGLPFRFLRLGGERRLLLRFLKECLDGCNVELGVAVLAGHVVVSRQKGEGGAAVGAFVADACVCHISHLFYDDSKEEFYSSHANSTQNPRYASGRALICEGNHGRIQPSILAHLFRPICVDKSSA